MDRLKDFNLNEVMTSVFIEGVFFIDSGLWGYYQNDTDFDNDNVFLTQKHNENFEDFTKRIITQIMDDESKNEEPLVTINFAIYCSGSAKAGAKWARNYQAESDSEKGGEANNEGWHECNCYDPFPADDGRCRNCRGAV